MPVVSVPFFGFCYDSMNSVKFIQEKSHCVHEIKKKFYEDAINLSMRLGK